MTVTPEATPFILQARSHTREANRTELSRGLVEPGTLIIDAKRHLLPPWYREPESKPVPTGYQETHRAKVPLSGIKFHVTGRDIDEYQPINVAEIIYCFNTEHKPVVILRDGNGHIVEIPLGDQNKSFIQKLADLQFQINQEMEREKPDINAAITTFNQLETTISESTLITGILDGLGSGSTVNDVVLRVLGGIEVNPHHKKV